jgi:sec-independent protein translocase protein TatA
VPSSLGPAEIVAILVVALIVLGPKRLPEAGRQVGKAIAEVRRWSQGFQTEVRNVIEAEPEPAPAPSMPPLATNAEPPAAANAESPAAANGSSDGSGGDGPTNPPVEPPPS